jgi:hypothetical protein
VIGFILAYAMFCIVTGTILLLVFGEKGKYQVNVRRIAQAAGHVAIWTLPLFVALLFRYASHD